MFSKYKSKLFLIILLSGHLTAENLLDIYNEALENDPTFKAAEYSYLADKEIVVQGRAALLPSITLSGSTNWNEYYQDDVLQQQYNSFSKSARVSQPLFRLDTWFNFKRSKSLTNAAEAEFAYEQQNLILRTAELYFGVLRAIDNLNAAISEEKAIKKQLDQAQQRYEVGLSAITGVQEAQLAYDLSKAARINNEGNLFSAREALNALIGREIFSLDELGEDLQISSPFPNSKEDWVNLALKNNYQLKAAKLQRDAAQATARASASNHLPQVDLVGRISQSTTKQGKFGGFIQNPLFGVEQDTRQYSIQFSLPLFAGGAISSARRQAYANYDRSKEQAIYTERSTIRDVRSNHFGVQTQVANVTARKQALASAESALEATQIGYEVGTRNTVDLLDAQKRLFQAQRDYSSSRYEYIISMLRLKASVGLLSPDDLFNISNQMD